MFDAIIILCGGISYNNSYVPNAWSLPRCEEALKHSTKYYIISTKYTCYKPPYTNEKGFPITESEVYAQFLISKGVPPKKILLETMSVDTIGNIYFTRLLHTDVRQWFRLAIITSKFHMARVRTIGNIIWNLEPSQPYNIVYIATDDSMIPEHILKKRQEKETQQTKNTISQLIHIQNMSDLHNWMYTHHKQYICQSESCNEETLLLKTY